MFTDILANPTVKAAIEALQKGDRTGSNYGYTALTISKNLIFRSGAERLHPQAATRDYTLLLLPLLVYIVTAVKSFFIKTMNHAYS